MLLRSRHIVTTCPMHTPVLLPVVYLCVYVVSIAGADPVRRIRHDRKVSGPRNSPLTNQFDHQYQVWLFVADGV
jgi:hypothetical protein